MTEPKTILLLAAHGSSHPMARQALEGFAGRVRKKHAGLPVYLAYTALQRPGCHPAELAGGGLAEILAELEKEERFDLRVQSLHVIAGDEFDRTREVLEAFAAARGASLTLSGPLLSGPQDIPAAARALAQSLTGLDGVGLITPKKADCASSMAGADRSQAVVLMGHGTTHEAQELYRALADELAAMLPLSRLGVLEAADPSDPLSIKAIAKDLAASGVRMARLVPFLTVAGRHAHKDLAGAQSDSWKSVLEGSGIAALPDLAGLVERGAFAGLWLERLKKMMVR